MYERFTFKPNNNIKAFMKKSSLHILKIFKNFANILVQLIPDLGVCVVWTAHAPQHT